MTKFDIKEIKGVIPALLTPFDKEENIDEIALEKLVEYLIDQGANGLYVTGSTGEGFLMDTEEKKRVIEIVTKVTNKRIPIIVHVGAISTKISSELIKYSEKCGADAISSVPPFYYKFTEEEIIGYYKDLAKASSLPMIVYNIPLAGLMGYDTMVKLGKIDGVKGIKYTTTTHFEITRLKEDLGEDFMIYSGSDEMGLSGLLSGADGLIGSTMNVLTDIFLKVYDNFKDNKITEANYYMKQSVDIIMKILSYGDLFAVLKMISRWNGIDAGYSRKPFKNFTDEEEVQMKSDFIKKFGEEYNHVEFIRNLK